MLFCGGSGLLCIVSINKSIAMTTQNLAQRPLLRALPFIRSRVCPCPRKRQSGVVCQPQCSANKPTESLSPFSSAQPRVIRSTRIDSPTEEPSTSTSYTTHKWSWKGHAINYAVSGMNIAILLQTHRRHCMHARAVDVILEAVDVSDRDATHASSYKLV
jgi:hypothetical protein